MAKPNQSALKTQGTARKGPSLDLFGDKIEEEKPAIVSKPTIWVIPQSIVPEIPLRPFSVTRINATTVVIWNE